VVFVPKSLVNEAACEPHSDEGALKLGETEWIAGGE
jgi:hypothetical protein